jgi:hypothetical protein
MGNINTIKDKDGNVIGQADLGLACYAVVIEIIKKYNPDKTITFPKPGEINGLLEPAYEKGKDYEVIQLQVFINDKSTFTEEDIEAFEMAAEKCLSQNEEKGPKRVLIAVKELIEKYGEITMEYVAVTPPKITVTKE